MVGRKPLPQQLLPPSGLFCPEMSTTNAGRSLLSLPRPYDEPGAQARPADDLVAGVHEDLRRRVIELRRLHRSDDGNLVGMLGQVRQELGDLGARLPVAREIERRSEQAGRALDERETFALGDETRRDLLAVVLLQQRLVVEEIDLRWCARHEQVDDLLRLRGNLRRDGACRLRQDRVGLGRECEQPLAHQRGKRERADAEAGFAEEVSPRDLAKRSRRSSLVVRRFIW